MCIDLQSKYLFYNSLSLVLIHLSSLSVFLSLCLFVSRFQVIVDSDDKSLEFLRQVFRSGLLLPHS